ncbi:helix-turn-helix domain-containing protein [Streptomyces vastus]|uniref:Transcription regulator TrmB N-terminal domain-containing protein n=1 Tax=Streptomyces vastus TaxID=285451 RepID=A0ABP6E7K6_9ACTN
MSETATADQLAGLSPAIISVYTQLVAFTDPATVDDIAQAAATPRSSTFKALVALEKRGLAHRDRGIQNGPNRRPDLWHATYTNPSHASEEPFSQEEPTHSAPGTAPASEPAAETDLKTDPEAPAAVEPEENSEAPEAEQAASAAALPAQRTEPTDPTRPVALTSLPDGNKRLASGCLRQLVINHLNAHAGEAFTATRISRMIDRSSGAIANALATLAKQGLAEQVTDRPRTYRAAPPQPGA